MSKVYSYEQSQKVISDAWDLAIKHLETTLPDQYSYNATRHAWDKFQDYVEQDIEFLMECDLCGKVDGECEFTEVMINSEDLINICFECETKHNIEVEK